LSSDETEDDSRTKDCVSLERVAGIKIRCRISVKVGMHTFSIRGSDIDLIRTRGCPEGRFYILPSYTGDEYYSNLCMGLDVRSQCFNLPNIRRVQNAKLIHAGHLKEGEIGKLTSSAKRVNGTTRSGSVSFNLSALSTARTILEVPFPMAA
jgi:hypothetical protein